jgi:hypothetical protein
MLDWFEVGIPRAHSTLMGMRIEHGALRFQH